MDPVSVTMIFSAITSGLSQLGQGVSQADTAVAINDLNQLKRTIDAKNATYNDIISKANSILSRYNLSVQTVAPQLRNKIRKDMEVQEEKIANAQKQIDNNNSLYEQGRNVVEQEYQKTGLIGLGNKVIDKIKGEDYASKLSKIEHKVG